MHVRMVRSQLYLSALRKKLIEMCIHHSFRLREYLIVLIAMVGCNHFGNRFATNRDGNLSIKPGFHDAGTVKRGDRVEGSFRVQNGLERPIAIQNLITMCSCTVTKTSLPIEIGPGRVSPPIEYDLVVPGTAKGRLVKGILVDTDAGERLNFEIVAEVETEPELRVIPDKVVLDRVYPWEIPEIVVDVENPFGESVAIETSVEIAEANLFPSTMQGSVGNYQLKLRLGKNIPPGQFQAKVTLKGPAGDVVVSIEGKMEKAVAVETTPLVFSRSSPVNRCVVRFDPVAETSIVRVVDSEERLSFDPPAGELMEQGRWEIQCRLDDKNVQAPARGKLEIQFVNPDGVMQVDYFVVKDQ